VYLETTSIMKNSENADSGQQELSTQATFKNWSDQAEIDDNILSIMAKIW